MKFDDLIETIDMLDATQADAVIDWQLTESPAAKVEGTGYLGEHWIVSTTAVDGNGYVPLTPQPVHGYYPLALGDTFQLLLSGHQRFAWEQERDITRVTRMPVTSVTFRVNTETPGYTCYRLAWCHPDDQHDKIELALADGWEERIFTHAYSHPIGEGWTATLLVHRGQVHAYLTYDRAGPPYVSCSCQWCVANGRSVR